MFVHNEIIFKTILQTYDVMYYMNRFSPRSIMHHHDAPYDDDMQSMDWQWRHSSCIYRIALTRLIKENLQHNALFVVDTLVPDLFTKNGINDKEPSYLYHLVYCLLTNENIDTTPLELWINDRYREGVDLSVHTLPLLIQQRIYSYLRTYDKFSLCKTGKILADFGEDNTFEDESYKRWCTLTFNRDNLKDIFMKYVTPDDLIDFILKDARAIPTKLISTLNFKLKRINREFKRAASRPPIVVCNPAPPAKKSQLNANNSSTKPALVECHPPAAPVKKNCKFIFAEKVISKLAGYFSLKDFFCAMYLNFDWLSALLCEDTIMNETDFFREIKFTDKHFHKWQHARSSWFLYSGACRMNYIVSKSAMAQYRPNKVPLFGGYELRYYRGTTFHVKLLWDTTADLTFVACLPRAWDLVIDATSRFDFYHISWFKFCLYLRRWADYIEYFYVAGNYIEGYQLPMSATCLLMDKGVIDWQSLDALIYRNEHTGVFLHEIKLLDIANHNTIKYRYALNVETHLLCFDCSNLYYLGDWEKITHLLDKITIVKQYTEITEADCIGLIKLMEHKSTSEISPELTIILYHSYHDTIKLTNNMGETDLVMDKFWPLVKASWRKIKSNLMYFRVNIGFVMVKQIGNFKDHKQCLNEEYMIDITIYKNNNELAQAGDGFRRLFAGLTGDNGKPITRFWKQVMNDFQMEYSHDEWADIGYPMMN